MKFIKFFALLVLLLVAIAVGLIYLLPSFGGTVSGKRLETAKQSNQYKDGKFANVIPQSPRDEGWLLDNLEKQFLGKQKRVPPSQIPIKRLTKEFFKTPSPNAMKVVWLGHASVYLEIDGQRILIDPVFSQYASPIPSLGPKRFHPTPVKLEDLPRIDAVVISHDHYDHLDMKTAQNLVAKGAHLNVPLGVGAHLERWKIPATSFTEFDWWQKKTFGQVEVISTPARHYSGRGIFNHKKTLWSSWSIIGPHHKVFYSGDTGYSPHFSEIGARYGPFDLSVMKVGAYGPSAAWIDIHMSAEDSVKAHIDIKAKRMLPVHWGTFNLGFHAWDEPIIRTKAEAEKLQVDLLTPQVGDVIDSNEPFESQAWWEDVK